VDTPFEGKLIALKFFFPPKEEFIPIIKLN
jgi:hypothetical protein